MNEKLELGAVEVGFVTWLSPNFIMLLAGRPLGNPLFRVRTLELSEQVPEEATFDM